MATRGRGNQRARSATLPPRARRPSMMDVQKGYVKRLDELAMTMIESFKSALAAGKVADRADNARGEYQTQVEATKLARAAEEILRLTAEVQLALIVQDIGESSEEEKAAKTALETDVREAKEELARLRNDVAGALTKLEAHYYRSVPHVRVHDARAAAAANDATPMEQ